jgi:hypothetical protein
LAPGGRPLPTPPLCLSSKGNLAGAPLLGRNTRWDGPGCTAHSFPPSLVLFRAATELANVASWDAFLRIVYKILSLKRSSVASFPGATASGVWQDEFVSRSNQCHNRLPSFFGWCGNTFSSTPVKRLAPYSWPAPPFLPLWENTLYSVQAEQRWSYVYMIFSLVSMSASTEAFIAFNWSLSFASLNKKPSSLCGLIEKTRDLKTRAKISLGLLSNRRPASRLPEVLVWC